MAMTKKESARVEELLTRCALRATAPVEPDVAPPTEYGDGLSVGFLPVAGRSDWPRVLPACSLPGSHSVGRTDRADSQRPRWLYSTRLLALRALRYEVEQHCASLLRKVDRMIEEEGE